MACSAVAGATASALSAVIEPAWAGPPQAVEPIAGALITPALPWDINGDGYAELVIGVPGENFGSDDQVGVFHLLPSGPTGVTASGSQMYDQSSTGIPDVAQAHDRFGWTQASGDFNGDGYADLAVSAPLENLGAVVDSGHE